MAAVAYFSPNVSMLSVEFDAAGTYNIDNPSLAFRIASIQVYNGAGTPNVSVTDGTNVIAPTQAVATDAWTTLELDEDYCNITTGEGIRVITADAATTKMLITCIDYASGYPLAVS
jgi:hypothetical protein